MKGAENVTKPACNIVGIERNIYALIGKVSATLEEAGFQDWADDFVRSVVSVEDYDGVLGLSQDYVQFEYGGTNEPATE